MFNNNMVKISEKMYKQNLLKNLPPGYLYIICIHLYFGEKRKYLIFKKNKDNKTFCA